MRILVLEDDPGLGALLEVALSEQGYAVDLRTDYEDSWHLGSSEPFGVVILDLGLPVMDVFQPSKNSVTKGSRCR